MNRNLHGGALFVGASALLAAGVSEQAPAQDWISTSDVPVGAAALPVVAFIALAVAVWRLRPAASWWLGSVAAGSVSLTLLVAIDVDYNVPWQLVLACIPLFFVVLNWIGLCTMAAFLLVWKEARIERPRGVVALLAAMSVLLVTSPVVGSFAVLMAEEGYPVWPEPLVLRSTAYLIAGVLCLVAAAMAQAGAAGAAREATQEMQSI